MILSIRFLEALLFTIVVELAVAWLLKYDDRKTLITIAMTNIITNPLLNYLMFFAYKHEWIVQSLFSAVPLEVVVVLAEWGIFVYALRAKGKESRHLLMLSLIINAFSYLLGKLIAMFFFWP